MPLNDSSDNISHPLKYMFGYLSGFIFLLGIVIYLYLLITDHLEDLTQHTTEEIVWMYLFLCILVIGFILSYYTITYSIYTVENLNTVKENGFGGIKKIPIKPSFGQYKTIHSSKFTI